jgi:V8-like Glu-specific endopeptidase
LGVVLGLSIVEEPEPDYERMQSQTLAMKLNGDQTCSAVAVSATEVLTAGHCIEMTGADHEDTTITLHAQGGSSWTAQVKEVAFESPRGPDGGRDLALLEVKATLDAGHPAQERHQGTIPAQFVATPECEQQELGETVFVAGFPHDAVGEYLNRAVTKGQVISTTPRAGLDVDEAWLQLDAVTWHGNSGGPVFDLSGDLVGIVSHGNKAGGAPVGHNYAVSAPRLCAFIR